MITLTKKNIIFHISRLLYEIGIVPSIKYEGISFYYEPDTDMGRKLYWLGANEKQEIEILKKYLKEDGVVIDIGANVGGHSIAFANTAPKGKIFAFEPSSKAYKILIRNAKQLNNVTPLKKAISNKIGTAIFHQASDSGYSGLKDTKRKRITKIYSVPTTTIDNFVSGQKLDKLDLIKIDVEGTEADIILGAWDTVSKFRPIIFCEICENHDSNEKTIDLIESFGYNSYIIKDGKIEKFVSQNIYYYNYLFIPKTNK